VLELLQIQESGLLVGKSDGVRLSLNAGEGGDGEDGKRRKDGEHDDEFERREEFDEECEEEEELVASRMEGREELVFSRFRPAAFICTLEVLWESVWDQDGRCRLHHSVAW
jgi:hypothetical protein